MTDLVDADDATRAAPMEPATAWPTPTGPPLGTVVAEAPADAPSPAPAAAAPKPPGLTVASGPGAIFSDAMAGPDHAGPSPAAVAPVPAIPTPAVPTPSAPHPAAPAPAVPAASTPPAGRAYADFLASGAHETPTRRTTAGRGRAARFFSRLVVLAVLGGLAAAGAVWGPDLYERWRGDQAVDEPDAPLTFPTANAVLPPIRTATFVIDGLDADTGVPGEIEAVARPAGAALTEDVDEPDAPAPRSSYTVTIDFVSTASRIVIDRGALPDLEVLTAFDDAVVRRVDQDVWYRMPRGELPVTEPADRLHWVRSLDELFPPEVRRSVTIEDASVSDVAGVPTRRLLVRFDQDLLAGPPLGDPTALDPTDDIAEAATGVPPTSAGPTSSAPAVPSQRSAELEIWVDDAGLVRRASGDLLRGAEAVTVLEVSDQSWLPAYPDPSQLRPLTAAALIELGL